MKNILPIMRSNNGASWFLRLWEFTDGKFYNAVSGANEVAPAIANTFITVAYNALDCYSLTIPAALPSGEYAVLLYSIAAAGNCVAMQIMRWSIRDGIIDAGKNFPILI